MMAAALIPQQEGYGGSVLGDRGKAAVLERCRRTLEEGGQEKQGAGGASAEDGTDGIGASDGRHCGPVHCGPRRIRRPPSASGPCSPPTSAPWNSSRTILPGSPFSIRDWVEREDESGFLFLTSRGDQHASLRGLISTWLEIAVNAMLSLEQSDGRRIWVILDELPTLHQVPSLQPGLAESRQFGGSFVLGVQVISALRDLYGRNGAETISGLCGTRVVLGSPDRDTAQWSADCLGRSEVEEMSEGLSYGANTIRDGVSLTPKRELRALALASEIMRLQNLNGYLRFPGPLPVARIKLDYAYRPKAADRFVPLKRQQEGESKSVGLELAGSEPEHDIGSTREILVDAGPEGTVSGETAADTEPEGTVTVEIPVGDEAEDEKPSTEETAPDTEDENPPTGGKASDTELKGVVI